MQRIIAFLVAATGILISISSSGVLGAQGGGKNQCKSIPTRTTLYNTVVDPITGATLTSAIYSDGAEYVDGASGVSSRINICSGTNDATLNIFGTRKIGVNFPNPIPGSVIQEKPAWAPGALGGSGFINVRNIVYSRLPFTTHVGSSFSFKDDYRLRFMPFIVDAPDLHIDPNVLPSENTPYDSSFAKVYPQPFDCNSGGAIKPSWIVIGNNVTAQGFTQVGTLHKLNNNGSQGPHEGQYSMPFELRIEALSCFNY